MTPKTQVRIPATRNIAPIPNPIAPSFFAAFFQLIWLGLGSTAHLVQVSPDTRKVDMHPSWPFSNSATFSRTRRPIRVRSFPKFKLGVCESKSFGFTRFESPVLEIQKLFSLPLMCPNDPKNAGSDPSYPKYCSDSKSDCAIVFRSLFPANLTWFGKYCSLGSGFTRYPKSRYAPKLTIFELGDFFPNAPADSSPVFSQV